MPSAMIHICVAKRLNEKLKRNEKGLFLGTIAPDISQLIGEPRVKSHFLENKEMKIPKVDEFLEKYKNDLSNNFTLGYFIHLYTDKLWLERFIDKILESGYIMTLDGETLELTEETLMKMLYQDYTNMNIDLIDHYEIDLKLFYEEFMDPKTKIDEIPMDKLHILVNQMGLIIKNSMKKAEYLFNIGDITEFIETAAEFIYQKLEELNVFEELLEVL